LLPNDGEKLEGLKASQDNIRAKVAPSATLNLECADLSALWSLRPVAARLAKAAYNKQCGD
jgi:hypothetical protein